MSERNVTRRFVAGLMAWGLLLVACSNEPEAVRIAIMTASNSAREALQEAIDTTYPERTPRIIVSREFKQVLPRQQSDDALAGTLNEAYSFAQDPNFVAIVGPAGSRDALIVGPVFREFGLPFIMPTANSPQIVGLAPTGLSLAPSLEEEADFIAEFVAQRLLGTTALFFYESDEWGSGLREKTASALWFRGVRVLEGIPVSTWTCNQGHGPESPPIRPAGAEAALHRHQPDVIVLATRNQATACLAEVIQRLAPGTPMVSGDGTEVSSEFVTRLGAAADQLYSVTFWHHSRAPSTGLFEERLGHPPTLSQGMTFEATMLLVRAIREVGPSREALLQFLVEKSRSGKLLPHVSLLMLRAGVPIRGLSAEISSHAESGSRP